MPLLCEVYLSPSKPWAQDPSIRCKRCGGRWSYGTYSDMLTAQEWNKQHKRNSVFIVSVEAETIY